VCVCVCVCVCVHADARMHKCTNAFYILGMCRVEQVTLSTLGLFERKRSSTLWLRPDSDGQIEAIYVRI
jgi:hypothetical protein